MKSPLRRQIRFFEGTPPPAIFADSEGSPIVIDTLTRIGYFLDSTSTVQSIAPGLLDSLIFTSNSGPAAPGELLWDDTEQTLLLGYPDGVQLRLGLDTFALVENETGLTIPKGTVVSFAGVGAANRLDVEPFSANGSQNNFHFIGVAAESIPDDTVGHCLKTGRLTGIDTTGAAVSETWLEGDVLYASPDTAGALTKVRPSAPDYVVPVAFVLVVDGTEGQLYIKPLLSPRTFYGSFSSEQDQTAAAIETAYPVTFNTTDIASGISTGTPNSRIICANPGLYNFQFSLQIDSPNSARHTVWIWYRVNGVDIANSAGRIDIASSAANIVAAWNFVHNMAAGDYFELMWAVDNTSVSLLHDTSDTFRPAIPSAILTVTQVAQ